MVRILEAAANDFAVSGYTGLSYERVAKQAGVNRTTIYRRWPKKIELVRDMILTRVGFDKTPPDTGSARGDLLEIGKRIAKFVNSIVGARVMHLVSEQLEDEELKVFCDGLACERDRIVMDVLRTEGLTEVRLKNVAKMFPATIFFREHIEGKDIDEPFLLDLIEILLAGASSLAGKPIQVTDNKQ